MYERYSSKSLFKVFKVELWRNDTLLAYSVKNQDKAIIQTATSKVCDRNGPALWLCMKRLAPTPKDKLVFSLFPTMKDV